MFIIIKSQEDRYILYFRAAITYELIATANSEEEIFKKLESFCHKFPTRQSLDRYAEKYKSYSTKSGVIYKTYTEQMQKMWAEKYSLIYEEKIQDTISRAFPKAPATKKVLIIPRANKVNSAAKKGISLVELYQRYTKK